MTSGLDLEKEELERIFGGFVVQAEKQIAETLHAPRKRVVVLSGPTACGKSDFALQLAKLIGGEIVSADSIQVYRGMDIGTAKPAEDVLKQVPHHMIDVRDVKDSMNVVDFYYEARQACQSITARDKIPIIVGGSGFYIHSFIYGPPVGPPSVPELRKELEEELEKEGAEKLFQRLRKLDPQYANTITKNDKQKIIRALEIITLTGNKVSQLSWKVHRYPQVYDFRCWFLYRPREHLHQLIEERCETMVERGFLPEVEGLLEGGIRENNSAMQAIGYRQAIDYLESSKSEEDYRRFMEKFKQMTRKFSKRQFTWFRQEPLFRWLDLDLHDPEVALDMVIQDYEVGDK